MSNTGVTTLAPNGPAQLLTQSAGDVDEPTTIINDSADRAYLGGDYSVGPANATPIDPGTSISWTTPGEVWAIAAPNAAAAVTLRVTDDATDWQPSPYAIAAATAAKLLASGVPDVLIEDLLADVNLFPGDAVTVPIARYNSVIVAIDFILGTAGNGSTTGAGPITLDATQTVGRAMRSDTLGGLADKLTQKPTYRLSADGDTLVITNTGATRCSVRLIGTNRPAPARVSFSASGFGTGIVSATAMETWVIAQQAFTAGTATPFTKPAGGDGVALQPFSQGGECDLIAFLGTTTTVTAASVGLFDATGNSITFLDTKSPDAYTDTANRLVVARRQFIPPGSNFSYIARVAGSYAPTLRLIFRP